MGVVLTIFCGGGGTMVWWFARFRYEISSRTRYAA
jgi:hypothetical protein